MLYLLWGFLNLLLSIYVLFLCYQAIKLLKEHKGWGQAILFTFILLSFMAGAPIASEVEGNYEIKPKNWVFNPADSLEGTAREYQETLLEKNLISSYHLILHHGKAKGRIINIPENGNLQTYGYSIGTSLYPKAIVMNPTENPNEFKYEVLAVVSWKLMTIPVYSQVKQWSGRVVLK